MSLIEVLKAVAVVLAPIWRPLFAELWARSMIKASEDPDFTEKAWELADKHRQASTAKEAADVSKEIWKLLSNHR